jgi:chromosome segregation ATPase
LRKEYEARKTKLETDIVAIERDRESEKQKRMQMQRDYESMKHEVEDKSKKLVDATKQVRKLEQSLKVENATSDKLQVRPRRFY